jgi:DNA-directed RNA polymerase specialized sigma subunit
MNKRKLYPDTYENWKNHPTPENTASLLRSIEPTISGAVRSYAGGDPKYRTRARILAVKALKSYDPSKGAQLNTYLMSQLRPLTRITRQRQNVIHVPENIYFNQRAIVRAREDYMEKYQREPSDTAVADATGLTVRQIKKADAYNKGAVSSSMGISEKGDFMNDNKKRDYYDIWTDYVYTDLDDKDKKIFEGVTGYNGAEIKPKQVIAKELKMSPAAVSYRISNITSKLEEMPTDAE